MPYGKNEMKAGPFSEEDVCIVSKRDPCIVLAGTKMLYSGQIGSGDPAVPVIAGQASGYNYWSGEADIEPINLSGWGEIRIPELNQLHKIFVFPKNPCVIVRPDYLTMALGEASGLPSGRGSCSGKVALLHWKHEGLSGYCWSGRTQIFNSGLYNSGPVDYIAFGSEY